MRGEGGGQYRGKGEERKGEDVRDRLAVDEILRSRSRDRLLALDEMRLDLCGSKGQRSALPVEETEAKQREQRLNAP